MVLELKRIDGENCANETHRFDKGKHILGRSDFKCIDKRISRRHLELNIKDYGDVELTSLHHNACYHRLTEESQIKIIETGVPTKINDSEYIGLLPDAFWYKLQEIRTETDDSELLTNNNFIVEEIPIVFNNENVVENISNNNEVVTNKISDDQPPLKRARSTSPVDIKPNIEELQDAVNVPSVLEHSLTVFPEVSVKNEPLDIKPDITSIKTEAESSNTDIKTEPSNPNQSSSTSGNPTTSRSQCTYGSSCYRRNPQHRQEYSHPGDPDWGNQVTCPWGASCYRRNPQHRRDFLHQGPPAPKPQMSLGPMPKNKDKNKDKKKKRNSWSGSESDDEYDLEDPFLAADSSDDYVPSDEDSFSSGKSSEEDDDINLKRENRRLKRDAKKIISK